MIEIFFLKFILILQYFANLWNGVFLREKRISDKSYPAEYYEEYCVADCEDCCKVSPNFMKIILVVKLAAN